MITAGQLRAARALMGMDQKTLAHAAGVSVQTIQRMEASANLVRGVVDSLAKVIAALEQFGIELINDDAMSSIGGRGVRLKAVGTTMHKARGNQSSMSRTKQPHRAVNRRGHKNA